MMIIKNVNLLIKFAINSIKSKGSLMINPNASKELLNTQLQLIDQILYHFMDGLSEAVLTKRKLQYVCLKIENTHIELSSISTDKDVTYILIWISEVIEEWIERAIELEEFESAQNLKNIMDNLKL